MKKQINTGISSENLGIALKISSSFSVLLVIGLFFYNLGTKSQWFFHNVSMFILTALFIGHFLVYLVYLRKMKFED